MKQEKSIVEISKQLSTEIIDICEVLLNLEDRLSDLEAQIVSLCGRVDDADIRAGVRVYKVEQVDNALEKVPQMEVTA